MLLGWSLDLDDLLGIRKLIRQMDQLGEKLDAGTERSMDFDLPLRYLSLPYSDKLTNRQQEWRKQIQACRENPLNEEWGHLPITDQIFQQLHQPSNSANEGSKLQKRMTAVSLEPDDVKIYNALSPAMSPTIMLTRGELLLYQAYLTTEAKRLPVLQQLTEHHPQLLGRALQLGPPGMGLPENWLIEALSTEQIARLLHQAPRSARQAIIQKTGHKKQEVLQQISPESSSEGTAEPTAPKRR